MFASYLQTGCLVGHLVSHHIFPHVVQKGNVFLCDYKTLDGIPCRDYNGKKLTVAAGLCLLYKNPKDELRPIAIQVLFCSMVNCVTHYKMK